MPRPEARAWLRIMTTNHSGEGCSTARRARSAAKSSWASEKWIISTRHDRGGRSCAQPRSTCPYSSRPLATQFQEPFTDNLQCVLGGSGRPTPCWGHMRYVCRCSFFSVSACPLSPSGRSGPTMRQGGTLNPKSVAWVVLGVGRSLSRRARLGKGWCYSSFRAHHPIPARAF